MPVGLLQRELTGVKERAAVDAKDVHDVASHAGLPVADDGSLHFYWSASCQKALPPESHVRRGALDAIVVLCTVVLTREAAEAAQITLLPLWLFV